MSVSTVRKELGVMLAIYWIMRDCLEGEPAIKGWVGTYGTNISQNAAAFNGGGSGPIFNTSRLAKAKYYLPMPNETDTSTQNQVRYTQYLTRAVWYPVTERTLEGMVGQIFLIPPVVKLPTPLQDMLKDVDGDGLSFEQSGKRAVRYTAYYGRAGLFIDYPPTDGAVTQEQQLSGSIKPTIHLIAPWNIVNWRTAVINGKNVLTQVVIREEYDDYDEQQFTITESEQYRVLRLDETTQTYTIQVYEPEALASGKTSNSRFKPGDVITPSDSTGRPFNYIPFTFIGAENNDSGVDKPPMYGMASMNIAHYRNSADYEEASFIVGNPTPWVAGLDQQWVDTYFKTGIPFGSRGGITLPVSATVGLLQATPNTMPLEAMKLKEDQMFALGAKLVTQKRTQRTATETKYDAASETSVLTSVSKNVSAAYEFAFKAACAFSGDNANEVKVALNTEFELNDLTPDDVAKVVASWSQGAVASSEMRETIRKTGMATLNDAAWKAEVTKDRADGLIPPAMPPKGVPGSNPNNNPAAHAATATATAGA